MTLMQTDFKLVATDCSSNDQTDPNGQSPDRLSPNNFYKSAQWSADGTCVITSSANGHIQTFVVPPDLLEDRLHPLDLEPYSSIPSSEAVDAVTGYPGFDLQSPSSTLVLSAVNEHPIRLNSALTTDLVASYPLVHPTTEAFIKPHTLIFTPDGSHFIAGSERLISTFDLARPGQGPSASVFTGPKNNKSSGSNPATSMQGIVSALAIDQSHNVLAAGTLNRHVGIYDSGGSGDCVGVFSVHDTEADKDISGKGITQVLWSPCGRYLYIVERRSDGGMIYDIRKTGHLLGWLRGRCADTNQRLQADLSVLDDNGRHEIWAGGTDGAVRIWKNPHFSEGAVEPHEEHNIHADAVSSSVVHRTRSVLATVSGQRHYPLKRSLSSTANQSYKSEVALKLWRLQ